MRELVAILSICALSAHASAMDADRGEGSAAPARMPSRMVLALETTRVSLSNQLAPADPGKPTPWGEPRAVRGKPTECSAKVSPAATVEGHTITIRGADGGHLSELTVEPEDPDKKCRTSQQIHLLIPLARPLLLGQSPVLVTLSYHAEKRKGWAKGRLAAQVNGGKLLFDRLGGDDTPGEIRQPISPDDIIMASHLDLMIHLQGEAQLNGSVVMKLDSVTIESSGP